MQLCALECFTQMLSFSVQLDLHIITAVVFAIVHVACIHFSVVYLQK